MSCLCQSRISISSSIRIGIGAKQKPKTLAMAMAFERVKSSLTKLATLTKDTVFPAAAKEGDFEYSPSNLSSSSEISYSEMSSSEIATLFETWKAEHGKIYKTPEDELYRFGIFKDTLRYIEDTNKVITFRVGLNQFADLTSEEFTAGYCGGLILDDTC